MCANGPGPGMNVNEQMLMGQHPPAMGQPQQLQPTGAGMPAYGPGGAPPGMPGAGMPAYGNVIPPQRGLLPLYRGGYRR